MSQSQATALKQKASELPCLFVDLVEKYSKVGLKSCETKESQVWRYASGSQTTKRLASYHDFIPELAPFLNSYSICEKHYNQIISTNYFYEQLLDDSLIDCNKRRWIDTNPDDTDSSKSTFNLNSTKSIFRLKYEQIFCIYNLLLTFVLEFGLIGLAAFAPI